MEQSLGISYNKAVFIVILLAIPISQLGFVNLISVLYPSFAVVSFILWSNVLYFILKKNNIILKKNRMCKHEYIGKLYSMP